MPEDKKKPVKPQVGATKKPESTPKIDVSKGLGFSYGGEGGTDGGFKPKPQIKTKTTPETEKLLKKASQGAIAYGPALAASAKETVRQERLQDERVAAREKELTLIKEGFKEQGGFNVDNLFTALKDDNNVVDLGGGTTLKSSADLEGFLQTNTNIRPLYSQNYEKIKQVFGIMDENDFANVIQGGLSKTEMGKARMEFETPMLSGTIFDPAFKKKYVAPGQPGYRSEYNIMGTDPVQQTYGVSQRQYQAKNLFSTIVNKGLNKTAYGEPIENYEDYYKYLMDPINRDAYGKAYNKQIKDAGFESTANILKSSNVFVGSMLGAEVMRADVDREMRIDKSDDILAKDILGQQATFDAYKGQAKTVNGLTEADLGKLIYDAELGYNSYYLYSGGTLDENTLIEKLKNSGLEAEEIGEKLEYYKTKYINSITLGNYAKKRDSMGFTVDPNTGLSISRYDISQENRAFKSLSEDEQKVAKLYDELRALEPNAANAKRIKAINGEIEALKNKLEVTSVEFFDTKGQILDGEIKRFSQNVYNAAIKKEQKTDIAILKEKRNALYEKLDWLENNLKDIPKDVDPQSNPSIPRGLTEEQIDAEVESSQFFLSRLGESVFGKSVQPLTIAEKVNLYKKIKAEKAIAETQAELKAINRLVYLNVDLTKGQGEGITMGLLSEASKQIKSVFSDDIYETKNGEIMRAAGVLQKFGYSIPEDTKKALMDVNENQTISQGFIESMKVGLLITARATGINSGLKSLFTGPAAIATRSYMAERYGKSGIGVYNVIEKAVVNYGVPFFAWEAAGQPGMGGIAEKFGAQTYDKVTGVLGLGKFVGTSKIGQLFYTFGRILSGGAASFTEEAFSNTWEAAKKNGFDFIEGAKNSFGETKDERLLNLRATALMCFTFSSLSLENIGLVFKTRQAFQAHLDATDGEISDVDQEILNQLDNTIKSSDYDLNSKNNYPSGQTAAAASVNINQNTSPKNVPVDYSPNMTESDVPNNLKATEGSSVSGSVGNDQVKVEKRTGDIGEEFYVSSKNGVVDNKVVYRYNSETGQLEGRGLTSTTDEFVTLNNKTRDYVETQSKENGIVSRDKAETIARKNLGITETQEKIAEKEGKVVYQTTQNESARRKKERVDKVKASAESTFKSSLNNNASQSIALFTGTAENVDETTEPVKKVAFAISKAIGNKIKINLSSFMSEGKALITNNVRKKIGKVADYIAPLLKDFDNSLFNTVGTDANGDPIQQRKTNNLDKFRAAVTRSTLYNDTLKPLVDAGEITQEDAINNLVGNLLLNKLSKIKEIFGNDTEAIQSFRDVRDDFNNFVAVKYTGSNTFSSTERFLLGTEMTQTTTKNRKADMDKKANVVAQEQIKRNEVARVLSDTGQRVDVEQVDAVRLIQGDITPVEFLENIGVDMTGMTQTQIAEEAKTRSEAAVDMTKYNEAVERRSINDAVRSKWKTKMNREAANVWGLKAKNPFKSRQIRAKRKAYAENAIRLFESNAQRAGITLDEYMNTMIETKKMTEEQFNKWLSENPNLVPFFQNSLTPAQLAADVNKALELQKKGMDAYRIELLTGVAFDAMGNPIPTSPLLELGGEFANMQKNLFSSRYELKNAVGREQMFGTKFVKTFGVLLGRTTKFQPKSTLGFSQENYIYKLSELIGDDTLVKQYPDLQLSNVRIVYEPGTPAFQFVPNFNYSREAKGTEFARPGDIVINMATMKDSNDLVPGLTRAVRKGAQFIENEYLPATADTYISPSTVLSAALELQANEKLTEAQVNAISDMIDFYKDKNIFQYAQYKSVFADLARILFYSNAKNLNETTVVEDIGYTYGLSDQEIQELKEKMFKHLTDIKNGGENVDIFFATALRLSNLTEAQMLDENFAYNFNPKSVTKSAVIPDKAAVVNAVIDYVDNSKLDMLEAIDTSINRLQDLTNDPNFSQDEKAKAAKIVTTLQELKKAIGDERYFNGAFDYNTALEVLQNANEIQDAVSDVMGYGSLDTEDEYGNVTGTLYRDPESLTFDANELSTYLSDVVDMVNEMNRLDVDKTNVESEDEVVAGTEAKQIYYQMFPGIDKYMGGVFDSYKPVSVFTKQELEDAFVGQNLMTKQQFDEKYADYQNRPELKSKSAASVFLDQNVSPKMTENQKAALKKKQFVAIQMRNNYAKNLGTAFYNNVDIAIADKFRNDSPIDLNSLKKTLIDNGAKAFELDFMGLDDFIETMRSRMDADGKSITTITKQELLDWATTRPELVSYDRFSEAQARSVEKVFILNNININNAAINLSKQVALDLTQETGDVKMAGVFVYFSDGNYRLVDLREIASDELEVYAKYAASDPAKYMELNKTLTDLKSLISKDGQVLNLDSEKKKSLENLVKIYIGLKDELDRKDFYKGNFGQEFEAFKGYIGEAALPDTYQEHLLTVPITTHPYIKNLNGMINELLEKISNTAEIPLDQLLDENGNFKSEYSNVVKESEQLNQALQTLVEQRNSFVQKYVDRKHFTKNPNHVLAHVRTEIVVDENGNLALFVHELQSDQTQEMRTKETKQKAKYIEETFYPGKSIGDMVDAIKERHLKEIQQRVGATKERQLKEIEQREGTAKEIQDVSDYYDKRTAEEIKAVSDYYDNRMSQQNSDMRELIVEYFDKNAVLSENERTQYEKVSRDIRTALKKTTPFPDSDKFTDLLLKQLLKIAADKGLSRIILTDPVNIAPVVLQMEPDSVEENFQKPVTGLNRFYNETIPKRIQALKQKLGFETSRTKLTGYDPSIDALNPKIQPLFDYVNDMISFDEYLRQTPEGVMKIVEAIKSETKGDYKILTKILSDFYGATEGTPVQIEQKKQAALSYIKTEFDKIRDSYFAKQRGDFLVPNPDFLAIDLTPQTNRAVAEGMAMFQQNAVGAHGATVNMDTGKTIMFALSNPNIFTAMHELAHVREKFLTADERLEFLQSVGHDVWTRETSELFARGFERYLAEGKAPNSKLQKIFEDFKKWMGYIYQYIQGSEIDVPLSEPMRRIYASMLGEAQTTAQPTKASPAENIFDKIATFIDGVKANPEFKGITDDELYSALLKSGFDPIDLQDYFSLRQRANIEKQQRGGMFKEEADVLESEADAIRTVRDQKALTDEIENIDSVDYPVILQTLFDTVENGDVPLAMAIKELIEAKQTGRDPDFIREKYAQILKAGTGVGRMLQLFRQLTKDSYLTSTRALFNRSEKKGLTIPEAAKKKIMDLAIELDKLKEKYKLSRLAAESDPYGMSKYNPALTNLEYNQQMYNEYEAAVENYVNARQPYEGDNSLTTMYISFVKGGLMTPGSLSVNTTANVVKFLTDMIVNPLSSVISWVPAKVKQAVTGIKSEPSTKKSLTDLWMGVKYGMPRGLGRAWRILKDGTFVQSYQSPANYVQGYNSFKSMKKTVGVFFTLANRALGKNDMTNQEIAEKYGYKLDEVGKLSSKERLISGLQGTFGIIPDIIFRAMGATDAIFRDYAYYSAVSEDFKFSDQYKKLENKIKTAATPQAKEAAKKELTAMRKAYIVINSDYGNKNANAEALRFVYANDNAITDWISRVNRVTKVDEGSGKLMGKLFRLVGVSIIPFTKIPTNYAIELIEFLLPEYALAKMGVMATKSVSRRLMGKEISSDQMTETARKNSRDMDRILARALVGTGVQYIASLVARAGALSGSPSDENEEDKKKSNAYVYSMERPYSINITLLRAVLSGDESRKSGLWDMKNDLIIDYKGFGIMGAALYIQFKENKINQRGETNKYVNRGIIEDAIEQNTFSMFGNYGSAGKYIIDQTFVRGIQSAAKGIVEASDDNVAAGVLADMVLTLSAGLVPNSTAWIDKMNRKYVVDYDAKDAPAFKAFGAKVESPFMTTFFTKLAIKMSERWPIGDPNKLVDLPFIETELENMPVKVDAFGKPVLQTPEGAVFGKFLYNTFDITKATRGVAGYEVPDWEALVYLACKKGEAWQALPSQMPKMLVDKLGNKYKLGTDEYNNLLVFNANIRRELVQKYIIDKGVYKQFIDIESDLNYNKDKKTPIGGMSNPSVLLGYEQLGVLLQQVYSAADAMTMLGTWTMIDAERLKMYEQDPDKFWKMYEVEMSSVLSPAQRELYGGQEEGDDYENFVRRNSNGKIEQKYQIDMDIVSKIMNDPTYFRKFGTGLIEEMKRFNGKPETRIISPNNKSNNNTPDASTYDYDFNTPAPSNQQKKLIQEKKDADTTGTYDYDFGG